MTDADVIAARKWPAWTSSDRLLQLWRASGASQGLPPALVIAGRDGIADPVFLGLWRRAFAGIAPLGVSQPIVTPEGKPTEWMLSRWRLVT